MDNAEHKRMDAARRVELAEFLRSRRAALQPEDVGLSQSRGRRRRVPGLRRDEVAELANVSTTWYTWLEQGRDVRGSPEVVDALGRALALDDEAREHLHYLAGNPVSAASTILEPFDASVQWFIDELDPNPACLISPSYDFVAWNAAYTQLLMDPNDLDVDHRNCIWMLFMNDEIRERYVDIDEMLRVSVAFLREEQGRQPGIQRSTEIINELLAASETFARLWPLAEVRRFRTVNFSLNHPEFGHRDVRLINMRLIEHPTLLLGVHQIINDEARVRLAESLGLQPRR